MPAIDQAIIQGFLDIGLNGNTTAVKGRALEDLTCYLFDLVPGVAVTRRNVLNAFGTEEIDVAVWVDREPGGFTYLPNIILIECKNWSKAVSSMEVNWFDTKLKNRGVTFGILIAVNGVTGDPQDFTASHKVIGDALKEQRRLIVVTRDDLLALTDTDDLVKLLKVKWCDLVATGS